MPNRQYLEAVCLVCGIRHRTEDNLILAQAQEFAMSMEAAAKYTSKQQGGASSKEHKLPSAADLVEEKVMYYFM